MNNRCKNDQRLFENDDTETMLLLSEVASSSFWSSLSLPFSCVQSEFHLCLTNRRHCL